MLIDWFTVAAQIINFLVLIALLKFFLYNRIINAMDERERQIAARLEAAEQQRQEAEREATLYREQQQAFTAKQSEMLARARVEVDTQRQELLDRARQEADSTQARWHQAIREEKAAFLRDLRQRASQQMYAITRRALTDLAHADLEQQMIETFLDQLRNLDDHSWQAIAIARRRATQPLVIRSAFDIPPEACDTLRAILQKHLGETINIRFETTTDVICGIELQTDGQKIAWSLEHYLETLEENLAAAFDEELREVTDADPDSEAVKVHQDEGRGQS